MTEATCEKIYALSYMKPSALRDMYYEVFGFYTRSCNTE